MNSLLAVQNLRVTFAVKRGEVRAVKGISLAIKPGETLGVIGESGSGKSVTALALMGLLEKPGRIEDGRAIYKGKDLLSMSRRELQDIRGAEIAMVFQDPMNSLNPLLKVGRQVTEVINRHLKLPGETARERTLKLLGSVGLDRPEEIMGALPFQLSGGMRQRVMLAMALGAEPSLLIADEPTTALDVTVQAQIIRALQKIQRETGMSMLIITHNWGVVAELANRVAVMHAGRLVETGDVAEVYRRPAHPYTKALLNALPSLGVRRRRLAAIEGSLPAAGESGEACDFAPRCPNRSLKCSARPNMLELYPGRQVACHYAGPEELPIPGRRRELA